jgi:hypothetical protein
MVLALVGPFASVNARPSPSSTLTVAGKWPGVVVVRADKRIGRCTFDKRHGKCTYPAQSRQTLTLVASIRPEAYDEYEFTGWTAAGMRCQGRTILQKECQFSMPSRDVNATARFGIKLDESHDWPGSGG